MKSPYRGDYVDIGDDWGLDSNKIWTVEVDRISKALTKASISATNETDNENLPIVLVHGFAAGVGIWSLNFDDLCRDRKIYAFDVLGFGRSSRPNFDFSSPEEVECNLINSFERWRIAMNLNTKFILLGHSFGGYLASSYALQFPNQVAHLILADPWYAC